MQTPDIYSERVILVKQVHKMKVKIHESTLGLIFTFLLDIY